jgi:hypothetical protein
MIINNQEKVTLIYIIGKILRLFITNVPILNNRGKNWNIYNKKGPKTKKGGKNWHPFPSIINNPFPLIMHNRILIINNPDSRKRV